MDLICSPFFMSISITTLTKLFVYPVATSSYMFQIQMQAKVQSHKFVPSWQQRLHISKIDVTLMSSPIHSQT